MFNEMETFECVLFILNHDTDESESPRVSEPQRPQRPRPYGKPSVTKLETIETNTNDVVRVFNNVANVSNNVVKMARDIWNKLKSLENIAS